MSELVSSYLEDASTRIKVKDRPIALWSIFTWIRRLATLSPDGLNKQLHPWNYNLWNIDNLSFLGLLNLFLLKRHPDGAFASLVDLVTLEELLSLLLVAYNATLDRVDQEILDLMHEVEKC
jgi:hypothetical protein